MLKTEECALVCPLQTDICGEGLGALGEIFLNIGKIQHLHPLLRKTKRVGLTGLFKMTLVFPTLKLSHAGKTCES